MFENAISLNNVVAPGLVTNQANDLSSMFKNNESLEKLKIDGWDTSGALNFSSMFEDASSIKNLILNEWNVNIGTDFSNMFKNASYLWELNLKYWNINFDSSGYSNMLHGLNNLKILNLRGWEDLTNARLNTLGIASSGSCAATPEKTCLDNVVISCSIYNPGSTEFVPEIAGYKCYGTRKRCL